MQIPNHPVSVAPMMDYTDRHFRYLLRLISKHTTLYTEMVTPQAILLGNKINLLDFSPQENPLVLQLGADNPKMLAEVAKLAQLRGYSEVNLNIGCPSPRVQKGNFGACLMNTPSIVVDCVKAMQDAVSIPITVKNRIGTNDNDSYDNLANFTHLVSQAGVQRFIVHARIAILTGISAKQNRKIPSIRYADVYKLKEDFPELNIIINGEIKTIAQMKIHLKKTNGVMLGRASCDNPMLYQHVDSIFFKDKDQNFSRSTILEKYWDYATRFNDQVSSSMLLRHISALVHSMPLSKKFRQSVNDIMCKKEQMNLKQLNFLQQILIEAESRYGKNEEDKKSINKV